MRLAMITPGYAPTPGGIESVATGLARGLDATDVDVEVWTHAHPTASQRVVQDRGVTVRRFATTSSQRYPVSRALWRYAAEQASRFDVVHVHGYHSTASVAALRVPRSIPVMVNPHYHGTGHTAAAKLMHRVYTPVGRRILGRADAVIAVSEAERALLVSRFPVATRTTVVHNAVDSGAIRCAKPWHGEPPTILVLGRLEPYKRVDSVIDAFAHVPAPAQLVIIGDGPDRSRLERRAATSGRANDIRLLGYIARADVDRWLKTAHVVVSMSEHESFGLVALEAAAAGARAVLADLAAHREVAGLLGSADQCRIVDVAGLPAALVSLLAQSRGGPSAVRTWEDVTRDYLKLYRQFNVT